MDADHLDIYGDHKNIKKAFDQFSKRVKHKVLVAKDLDKETCCYALEDQANYRAEAIRVEGQGYRFDLVSLTQTYKNIYLRAMGRHNLSNAIGALAIFGFGGVPFWKSFTCLVNL